MHLAGWDKADGDDPQAGRCSLAVPGAAPPVLLEQVPDSHHLRWAGSGHAPALCLLLAPMARCWFFTTDNNHVSKALVKVGSRVPPPCWGRTSRRDSPMRSTGCTVLLACIPWVLQLPEPGSGEQLEEAPWGCPPALPVLPPSTTACASTQCWPLLPRLTSEQTNGFSCSEAEVYPKCG